MGNQQPSVYKGIVTLAKNAKFGDGYFWKHPECVNYKVIFTSINRELLEVKYHLCPDVFSSGVVEYRQKNDKSCFANSKTLYRLTSTVHPVFTQYAKKPKHNIFKELTIDDFGLWYLDDGCLIKRKEYKDQVYSRFLICIGDCCNTKIKEIMFKRTLRNLFGISFGNIKPNNSKATENNKTWYIPKPIALVILDNASQYNVLPNKFPHDEGSTTIPQGSRGLGLKFPKRHLPIKS